MRKVNSLFRILTVWTTWGTRWLMACRQPLEPLPQAASTTNFVLTGPSLQEEIARCIELGQSVILEGPRGCGKSFCAREGYKLAVKRGFVPDRAWVPIQGNKEIPRDYLAEDEIAFRLRPRDGSGAGNKKPNDSVEESANTRGVALEVWPARKDAPLFRFARRRLTDGTPITDGNSDRVLCAVDGKSCERFVLFLDEINRFSDGVLDSLLGLLEERVAVLGGREFELPVTVVMTMNPPGYDASARKLSPPLAARIGRTYRLNTPDVDTMCDLIVAGRLRKLHVERQFQGARGANVLPLRPPDPILIRKAALATLCLWGDVTRADRPLDESENRGAVSLEYLTPDSKRLLRQVMAMDSEVASAMRTVSELCHYGPDGRAIADWIVSASAAAIADAGLQGDPAAEVRVEHFEATAIKTLAHKMYDSFSAATRPDQTRAKEQAVTVVITRLLKNDHIDLLVARALDDRRNFASRIASHILDAPQAVGQADNLVHEIVRACFILARVTSDTDVVLWATLVATDDFHAELHRHPDVFEPADPITGARGGFFDARYDDLVRLVARCNSVCTFAHYLDQKLTLCASGGVTAANAAKASDVCKEWREELSARYAGEGLRSRLQRALDFNSELALVVENPTLDAQFEVYLDAFLFALATSPVGTSASTFKAIVPTLTKVGTSIVEFVTKQLGAVRRPVNEILGDLAVVRLIGFDSLNDLVRKYSTVSSRSAMVAIGEWLEACFLASRVTEYSGRACADLIKRIPKTFVGAAPCLAKLATRVITLGDDDTIDRSRWLSKLAAHAEKRDLRRVRVFFKKELDLLKGIERDSRAQGLHTIATEAGNDWRKLDRRWDEELATGVPSDRVRFLLQLWYSAFLWRESIELRFRIKSANAAAAQDGGGNG